MELRQYLTIVMRHWRIVLLAVTVSLSASLFLVLQQPPVYESTGTFVVRPRSGADEVQAFETLVRGVEINATYAAVARSSIIRQRAEDRLDRPVSKSDADVSAEAIAGVNIVSISVRARDPQLSKDFALAVGTETLAYVDGLKEIYQLTILDPPKVPSSPVGPNKVFTIGVGGVFGAMAGSGLALLAHYLRGSGGRRSVGGVFDPQTGLYNEAFFGMRLRQEASRASRTGHPVSVAVLKVLQAHGNDGDRSRVPATRTLRGIGRMLQPTLREEDVLSSPERGTFAVVLPDTKASQAEGLMTDWRAAIHSTLDQGDNGSSSRLRASIGICELPSERFVGNREVLRNTEILAWARHPAAEATPAVTSRAGRGGQRR
jgi:diguanylate cyclase (GGDEF)-like protein